MRRIATSNEFFDILDKIGNGKFVTIGYVTGANLNVPTITKKNPLTNRNKKYPDYTPFKGEADKEIGALVKITSYNMRYLNRSTVGKNYGIFKKSANDVRKDFGLEPIGDRESYKVGTNWSPNGPELYKGNNADLQSHSYNPQNIYGANIKGVVYTVDTEGHIINALSKNEIEPYLKTKNETSGVSALRKMGAEEAKIKEYIKRMNDLKFRYINFESNSILWIAATINNEKIVYINDNLSRAVDGINISPEDFRAIARERYKVDLSNLQEMKRNSANKKIIRLTESDLRNIIANSVRKSLLSELDWKTKANESKAFNKMALKESFKNNQGYSHFAVNKMTNKIVNGWDYSDYDPSELRQFKKDYFDVDLIDYGLDPKKYRIVTSKYLLRQGIDPDDNENWANE